MVSATSRKVESLLNATPLAKARPRAKTVTSLLDLSYFSNLPVLSLVRSDKINCLPIKKYKQIKRKNEQTAYVFGEKKTQDTNRRMKFVMLLSHQKTSKCNK